MIFIIKVFYQNQFSNKFQKRQKRFLKNQNTNDYIVSIFELENKKKTYFRQNRQDKMFKKLKYIQLEI